MADANAGQRLSLAGCRHGLAIVVAPSVVYEPLRLKDTVQRNRILRIETSRKWTRLMPEAFSECAEILLEVRRLHPNWLEPAPDLSGYNLHVRDWTRGMATGKSLAALGFWNRVREHPDWVANAIHSDRLDAARIESKAAQVEGRLRKAGPMPLNDLWARLPDQPLGSEVEAWRWPAFAASRPTYKRMAIHIGIGWFRGSESTRATWGAILGRSFGSINAVPSRSRASGSGGLSRIVRRSRSGRREHPETSSSPHTFWIATMWYLPTKTSCVSCARSDRRRRLRCQPPISCAAAWIALWTCFNWLGS